MFSIYFIIRDILDIANKYSSLIIAAATGALAIVTYLNIKEIKSERTFRLTFRLRRYHTDTLKKEIIEPWIKQLKKIGEAKKGFPPLGEIKKEFPSSPYHYKGNYYYKGNDILVEGEKKLLFNDMEKHEGDTKLFQTYKGFKVNYRKLLKKSKNLKKKLYESLEDKYGFKDEFRFSSWEDFTKENKETREPGFFNTDYASSEKDVLGQDTLDFFLDLLLSRCSDIKFEIRSNWISDQDDKFNGLFFECKHGPGVYIYGVYIDRNITEEKETEIKNKIEETLKETKNKFRNEINEIHKLIDNINEDRRYVLKNLEELKTKEIYDGICKSIKFK